MLSQNSFEMQNLYNATAGIWQLQVCINPLYLGVTVVDTWFVQFIFDEHHDLSEFI